MVTCYGLSTLAYETGDLYPETGNFVAGKKQHLCIRKQAILLPKMATKSPVSGYKFRIQICRFREQVWTGLYAVTVLKLKAVFAMEILLALLGVAAFIACLWSSILCCVYKGCCRSDPVVAYAVRSFAVNQL